MKNKNKGRKSGRCLSVNRAGPVTSWRRVFLLKRPPPAFVIDCGDKAKGQSRDGQRDAYRTRSSSPLPHRWCGTRTGLISQGGIVIVPLFTSVTNALAGAPVFCVIELLLSGDIETYREKVGAGQEYRGEGSKTRVNRLIEGVKRPEALYAHYDVHNASGEREVGMSSCHDEEQGAQLL